MAKQAILIQCHQNAEQVNMLLDALDHPDLDLFIHVDKKSNLSDSLKTGKQIHILPDDLRVDVQWAEYSQVQATLNLLSYASLKADYQHYWLISGQDFPIKSAAYIADYLSSNIDINYIQIWPSKNWGGVKTT